MDRSRRTVDPLSDGQRHPVAQATWFDLDEHGGVLELDEQLAHLKLSLYVVVPFVGARTSSWWETEDGTWLRTAVVGLA
jgi:hypothetical protein